MKLGKLPAASHPKLPRLSSYLRDGATAASVLPPISPSADWCSAVPAANWLMYDNDALGTCTCAGAAHQIVTWTTALNDPYIPPEPDILTVYETLSGYSPSVPGSDRGCVLLNVLQYWQTTGISGHKISAFACLDIQDQNDVMLAIALFGGIYAGLQLPISAQAQYETGGPFDVAAGLNGEAGSWGGHLMVNNQYDAGGMTAITWGKAVRMTWPFFFAYFDEVYAILSPDWLNSSNVNPDGFDLAQLQADLTGLSVGTPGPTSAVVTITDAVALGAPGLLLAPNLVIAAPGVLAVGASVGCVGNTATITQVRLFPNFSLGLLDAPFPVDWVFGYQCGWSGGTAMIAGAQGRSWYANQVFTATGVTVALAGAAGSPVYVTTATGASLVGMMTSTTQAYLFTANDLFLLENGFTQLTQLSPAISRLYYSVLGRAPDIGGLSYWTQAYLTALATLAENVAPGVVMLQNPGMIADFTHSTEFQQIVSGYGTNPTQFVTYLYRTTFNRAPDAGGLAYWAEQLESGACSYDIMVLQISQSLEAMDDLSGVPL